MADWDPEIVALWPGRDPEAHKGSVGRVLIIAGSPGMTGAAALASRAALRCGAGLVAIACARSLEAILEVKTTCAMTRGLPDRDGRLGPWSQEALEPLLGSHDAIVVGPGLGAHPATQHWLHMNLPGWSARRPLVIDADGLNALAPSEDAQRALSDRVVLTPHPGELGRWLGWSAAQVQGHRQAAADALAARVRGAFVVKGASSIIGQGSRRAVNATGNAGMATAGAGDVLSGIIGALLAAGLGPFEAARLGAHLHGRAGDVAAQAHSEAGLVASDIAAALPGVLVELERAARAGERG